MVCRIYPRRASDPCTSPQLSKVRKHRPPCGGYMVELSPGGAQSWWSLVLVELSPGGDQPGGAQSWWSSVLMELNPGGAQSWWSSVLVELSPGEAQSWWSSVLVELSPGGAQSWWNAAGFDGWLVGFILALPPPPCTSPQLSESSLGLPVLWFVGVGSSPCPCPPLHFSQ